MMTTHSAVGAYGGREDWRRTRRGEHERGGGLEMSEQWGGEGVMTSRACGWGGGPRWWLMGGVGQRME
jgi:hypothetical protein